MHSEEGAHQSTGGGAGRRGTEPNLAFPRTGRGSSERGVGPHRAAQVPRKYSVGGQRPHHVADMAPAPRGPSSWHRSGPTTTVGSYRARPCRSSFLQREIVPGRRSQAN